MLAAMARAVFGRGNAVTAKLVATVAVLVAAHVVAGRSDLRAAAVLQMPDETGTAQISGIVLEVTGITPAEPSRRAIVTLTGPTLPIGRSIVTDDRGSFLLDRLPAGRFTLTASKPAYLTGAYGATRPGRPGVPLALTTGAHVSDLSITLTHGAAIGGTVRDDGGVPVSGVTVSAFRMLLDGTLAIAATARSDDRGMYRIFGLMAGDYLVSASQGPATVAGEIGEMTSDQIDRKLAALQARATLAAGVVPVSASVPIVTSSFAPVFYPHAFSPADAAKVTVAFGDDRSGADIELDRVHVVVVDGTVSGVPTATPLLLTMSQTGSSLPSSLGGPSLLNRASGDGPFQFGNVTPGHYVVTARTQVDMRPALWARAEIDVSGDDVHGVTLEMQPALHLTGRIVFDATRLTPPVDLSTIVVTLDDVMLRGGAGGRGGGGPRSALSGVTTDAHGNFDVDGVVPGTYRLTVSRPNDSTGWWLRSAVINGRDVLDAPIQIDAATPLAGAVLTFSDRHTLLSGGVTVPEGRAASDYFIVAFSDDRSLWLPRARRIQSVRVGTDGTYLFRDLPPGVYRLAALTDVAPDDLLDPAFFEALLPVSLRLAIGEGEQKTQSFLVGG